MLYDVQNKRNHKYLMYFILQNSWHNTYFENCTLWLTKIQCVPLATEPGISFIILPLMRILHRIQTHTTDTFLFISHTTNVILFKFRCNVFMGVRIIKEIPGSVASGASCIITIRTACYALWRTNTSYSPSFLRRRIKNINNSHSEGRPMAGIINTTHRTLHCDSTRSQHATVPIPNINYSNWRYKHLFECS